VAVGGEAGVQTAGKAGNGFVPLGNSGVVSLGGMDGDAVKGVGHPAVPGFRVAVQIDQQGTGQAPRPCNGEFAARFHHFMDEEDAPGVRQVVFVNVHVSGGFNIHVLMEFPACSCGKDRFQRCFVWRVDLGGKNAEFVAHVEKESVLKSNEH